MLSKDSAISFPSQCTKINPGSARRRSSSQVHLNYPSVVTTEPLAYMCRDEIVQRCKIAFEGLQPSTSIQSEEASRTTDVETNSDVTSQGAAEGHTLLGASHAAEHGQSTPAASVSGIDWERVIDFPHGSMRLLGSRKTRYMDSDPEWVRDKAYYPVLWDKEALRWRPTGIYFSLLCETSIFPDMRQVCGGT